ncbi:MAG: NAD(P)/FAD-dependent oxidoreductase [Oscillospiraceae bacterium]|nr:NAD(P)/FAD-dependent oxidoreductase [Oscillospiraceae bacterium]
MYDIMIIGGGPAAVSAALTAINRGKTVAVAANRPETTNLYKAELVTNYPGFTGTGPEMQDCFRRQLIESGAELIEGRALNAMPLGKSIGVAVGSEFYECKAVIICTGISRSPMCEGETEFLGRGVSYCATCDGMLYRGKTVAVIGDGEECERDAEFLRGIGCSVLCFPGKSKIEIKGQTKADTLIVGGTEYKTDCIFILTDKVTSTSLVPGMETEKGVIKVDRKMRTNIPGVFAAGDCTGAPYQVAKAAGEGCIAALSACEYIKK